MYREQSKNLEDDYGTLEAEKDYVKNLEEDPRFRQRYWKMQREGLP